MSLQKGITLKYLVVGDSGVGKTSLLVRYCDDNFHSDYLSTIGVDFKIKKIQCRNALITLNIWDTAGQQRFRNITKSFYKGANGIVLTYSITDLVSFNHIQSWIQQIKQTSNTQTHMIIVGSKSDLQSQRKVSFKQGKTLAQRYDINFIQTSAKDNKNITKVFESLTNDILDKINQQQYVVKPPTSSALSNNKEDKEKQSCC